MRYKKEEIVKLLEQDFGVKSKKATALAGKIVTALGYAEHSRLDFLRTVFSLLNDEFCDRGKALSCLNLLLDSFGLKGLDEDEELELQSFFPRFFSKAVSALRITGDAVVEALSNPQTRWSAILAIGILVSASGIVGLLSSGIRTVVGAPFRAVQAVSSSVSPSANQVISNTLPPVLSEGSTRVPINKPTATPLPTVTPTPKEIPEDLKPEGSRGGFMGANPMPEAQRQMLDDAVRELSAFAFGSDKFKGAIPIWRSFIERFEQNKVSESSREKAEFKEQTRFYECQCGVPLTEECRKTIQLEEGKTGFYQWAVELPRKYNLREDETLYVARALKLCGLVNEVTKLWPIPDPPRDEDLKSQEDVRKWQNARLVGEDLKRFKADVLISDPLLSPFKDLWESRGLYPDTEDPFGKIITEVLNPAYEAPLGRIPSATQTMPTGPASAVATLVPVGPVSPAPVANATPKPAQTRGSSAGTISSTSTPVNSGGSVEQEVKRMRELTRKGVMRIKSGRGLGTGFYLRYKGKIYIITNCHVTDGGAPYMTGTPQEVATWVAMDLLVTKGDIETDLSILKPHNWSPAEDAFIFELSDKDPVVGDLIWSIGFPGGASTGYVFNPGDVLGVSENLSEEGGDAYARKNIMVVNAEGNEGISGGPVVTTDLKVVGVYFAGNPGSWSGYGFAIRRVKLKELLDSLK